ncbi:lipopolysaccharide biosynthesis protein [Desertivirga arenae]|uniref:lipopolysaccharide biosynthesis protein n=1 Tax=Desertivirga arenae TaxID=2810309 RepID=UPI001A97933D|nr:lipopolysaccharide biosynthesis protein [Pedobacter sp. SYSU D00823]
MGIIQQQTVKGAFYSYLGILIGFFTTSILQPWVLSPEEVGLTSILSSSSLMFAQFAILGFNGTTRYFPHFRDEKNNHHGYLFLFCLVGFIGFVLFTVIAVFLKDEIINQEAQDSDIFKEYYWYLIPLTLFTLYFNVFDLYAQRLYDTVSGRVLREFAKRVFILLAVLFVAFRFVEFRVFMPLWLLANLIPTVLLAWKLYKRKQLNLKSDFQFIDQDLRKKLVSISLFAILTGSAPLIVENIDKFMINGKFGLDSTGIYSIALYFGTVITLPARSLYSIAYTVVSESWKSNDLANIRMIYRKSCSNQSIAAVFIFTIIWVNIDNIFKVLPPEYAAGKYVVFYIGLASIIDSATGINGVILATSRYFKYDSLFYLVLVGVTILLNLLLIPPFGITGAAMAVAGTYFVFNLFRLIFIYKAFEMQPYTKGFPIIFVIGVIVYYITVSIPDIGNPYLDSVSKAIVVSILYGAGIYFTRVSEDINNIADSVLARGLDYIKKK